MKKNFCHNKLFLLEEYSFDFFRFFDFFFFILTNFVGIPFDMFVRKMDIAKRQTKYIWSIHISCCIVVLSVLLNGYTTVYDCC